MNDFGHHHPWHAGLLGVDISGEDGYQITLGGNAGNKTIPVCSVTVLTGSACLIAKASILALMYFRMSAKAINRVAAK